jgi:hypothetical protein
MQSHRGQVFLTLAITILALASFDLRGDPKGGSDEKDARAALLAEFPATIRPKFKTKEMRSYWDRILLKNGAIQFSRVSILKYNETCQEFREFRNACLYNLKALPGADFVWEMIISEPLPAPSDQPMLILFLDPESKRILTAWTPPAG